MTFHWGFFQPYSYIFEYSHWHAQIFIKLKLQTKLKSAEKLTNFDFVTSFHFFEFRSGSPTLDRDFLPSRTIKVTKHHNYEFPVAHPRYQFPFIWFLDVNNEGKTRDLNAQLPTRKAVRAEFAGKIFGILPGIIHGMVRDYFTGFWFQLNYMKIEFELFYYEVFFLMELFVELTFIRWPEILSFY